MAQLLVRNIPDDVVDALKRRAARNGRSTEAEHRAILENVLKVRKDAFWARADALREATVDRNLGCSADLIREDRDLR